MSEQHLKSIGPIGQGVPPCLAIVDGNNIAKAAYHTTGDLIDSSGRLTGIAYGVIQSLYGLLWNFPKMDSVYVAWDSYPSWRLQEFSEYKMNRRSQSLDKTGENTWDLQKSLLMEVLPLFGIHQIVAENMEADDIAYLFNPDERTRILVSNDNDWLQLVDERTFVYKTLIKDDRRLILPSNLHMNTKYMDPDEVWQIKAIVGSKDDLPGCPTIGHGRASQYLRNELDSETYCRKIEDWFDTPQYKANVVLSRIKDVTTMRSPVLQIDSVRAVDKSGSKALKACMEMDMNSLVSKWDILWPHFGRLT